MPPSTMLAFHEDPVHILAALLLIRPPAKGLEKTAHDQRAESLATQTGGLHRAPDA